MTKQGTKTAVPRLRFPEFRKANSWRDDTLVDYATVVAGQSPEGAYYNETGEGLPFYQGKSDFGEIFLERPRKWTSQVTKRAGAGDIVMSVRAPVGALNVTTEDICIGRGLAAIQAKGSKWFLYYLLNSVSSSIIGNGGSVFDSINKDQIEKLRLFAPRDAAEQQKIAGCLTSLDEVIAAQGRKVEALKAHKRGLMQQLFPREGETRPRLRFPEFRDANEWGSWRLFDLFEDVLDFRGRTPKKLGMEWGGGDIISLSANNVKNGFIDYNAECYLASEELYSRWMSDANLQMGDIVFTMEAPLGKALLVPDERKYVLSQRVVAFKTKAHVVNLFLIQLIWSDVFQGAIELLATGSTAKGVSQKSLQGLVVSLPGKDEQQRIADCLSSLDTQITAETNQLTALKTHKQGLMQQLFPAPEAAGA